MQILAFVIIGACLVCLGIMLHAIHTAPTIEPEKSLGDQFLEQVRAEAAEQPRPWPAPAPEVQAVLDRWKAEVPPFVPSPEAQAVIDRMKADIEKHKAPPEGYPGYERIEIAVVEPATSTAPAPDAERQQVHVASERIPLNSFGVPVLHPDASLIATATAAQPVTAAEERQQDADTENERELGPNEFLSSKTDWIYWSNGTVYPVLEYDGTRRSELFGAIKVIRRTPKATATEPVADACIPPRTMHERELHAERAFYRDLDKLRQTHEIIYVEKLRIPEGSKLVECYETARGFVIMGDPDPDDERHNCDAMGCCTLSHVVARIAKEPEPDACIPQERTHALVHQEWDAARIEHQQAKAALEEVRTRLFKLRLELDLIERPMLTRIDAAPATEAAQ